MSCWYMTYFVFFILHLIMLSFRPPMRVQGSSVCISAI
jgi:hypothetical protein